ncbi:MAG: hypothetical protein NW237_16190 [Cyanobacteriota bacterium]|nr:hypothetical protein [Cyanobacteriota bacterium]
MRRCPACQGIAYDTDHACRRCGRLLRQRRYSGIPSSRRDPSPSTSWLMGSWRFPWVSLLLMSAVISGLGLLGWGTWIVVNPLLDPPLPPHFEPATAFGQQAAEAAPQTQERSFTGGGR